MGQALQGGESLNKSDRKVLREVESSLMQYQAAYEAKANEQEVFAQILAEMRGFINDLLEVKDDE